MFWESLDADALRASLSIIDAETVLCNDVMLHAITLAVHERQKQLQAGGLNSSDDKIMKLEKFGVEHKLAKELRRGEEEVLDWIQSQILDAGGASVSDSDSD